MKTCAHLRTRSRHVEEGRAGADCVLAHVRAIVEEETVYPVLEGKDIAGELERHPDTYVVMDKGPAGKGTEVNTRRIHFV